MNDVLSALAQALLAGHTDRTRLLRLHLPAALPALLPDTLVGVEAVGPFATQGRPDPAGAGFRFDVRVLAQDADLSAADFLGQPVLLELALANGGGHRPFHGHITGFTQLQADGGFAYYSLTIEPWFAFLRWRKDSFVFRNQTVPEILDSIFADYAQARLQPQWRWHLADDSIYRKRSTCTQYQESDLAFVSRLLAQEGLFYWFEHEADADGDALGLHTLVIADHPEAFADAQPTSVSLQRGTAIRTEEGFSALQAAARWAPQAREIVSWDYRTARGQQASAETALASANADAALTMREAVGQYAWPDSETGERFARVWLEGETAVANRWQGTGNLRSLAPGVCVTVEPTAGQSTRLAVLRVRHEARNNLGATLTDSLARSALHHLDRDAATESPYRQQFEAQPAELPYRAAPRLASGAAAFGAPQARAQTAIVVGTPGEPVLTDRDGRIRVQFHWQRGGDSHSQLDHPSGEDNAPATAGSWSWVRVMSSWAGANWGAVFTPRVGQEVIVDFIEGDPDRPVVTGAVYNGSGAEDAQHNSRSQGTGATTGNAPAWFAGAQASSTEGQQGHAHGASLWGIKTQAMGASQSGDGGFNQLAFDLTPGEARVQLATTQHASGLTLGAIRHQYDNQRLAARGLGTELLSEQSGALRAGSGLLLSTFGNTGGAQMNTQAANASLTQAQEVASALAQSARAQKAIVADEPQKLSAIEAIGDSLKDLGATQTRDSAAGTGGAGTVPAWDTPMIVAEAAAGLVATTPADAALVSGRTLSAVAADINGIAQANSGWSAARGIVLYAYGKASDTSRAITKTGLQLHAAHGPVSVQAQSDTLSINAQKRLMIASTESTVTLQGKDTLRLVAAGAALDLSGGNITLTAPGKAELKAASKNFTGPQAAGTESTPLDGSSFRGCAERLKAAASTQTAATDL